MLQVLRGPLAQLLQNIGVDANTAGVASSGLVTLMGIYMSWRYMRNRDARDKKLKAKYRVSGKTKTAPTNQDVSPELELRFDTSCEQVKSVAQTSQKTKLRLYGLFKAAKGSIVGSPGIFDIEGRMKYDAWTQVKDMGRAAAMAEYISVVEGLVETGGDDEANGTGQGGDGIGRRVSVLKDSLDKVPDKNKSIFDHMRDGSLERVTGLLDAGSNIDVRDEGGLGLLHHAADCGNASMVGFLLDRGCDIDMREDDGQTALHYASTNDYPNVVEILLARGCATEIRDNEGFSPYEAAEGKARAMLAPATH